MGVLTAEEFTKILHHNTNEVVYYSSKKADDSWRDYAGKSTSIPASLHFSEENCYTSVNNFTKGRRLISDVSSINGYFVDIDICHQDDFNDLKAEGIRNLVKEEIDNSELKNYTMMCHTGRGLAYYYLYDEPISRSEEELFQKHQLKYREVFSIFEKVLSFYIDEQMADVDWSVGEMARVCRLPDTVNLKSGKISSCEVYNKSNYYTPSEMWSLFDIHNFGMDSIERKCGSDSKKEKKNRKERKKIEKQGIYVSYDAEEHIVIPAVYLNNARGIARTIEHLCSVRKMKEGAKRNNTLFIYYNVQKVLHINDVEEAKRLVKELNDTFETPLSGKELSAIFKSVDFHIEKSGIHENGYYMYKRDKVAEVLGMDDIEIDNTGFFKNRQKILNVSINRKKKKEDEMTIRNMLKEGCTWSEIIAVTGRSNGFISKISKSLKCEKEEDTSVEKMEIHSIFSNKQYNNIGTNEEEPSSNEQREVLFEEKEPSACESSLVGVEKCVDFDKAYVFDDQYVENDEELGQVLDTLMSGQNVYICGKGGTGKSLVSKVFLHKLEEQGKNAMVAAPSGLAAFSVGGGTLHSLLKIDSDIVYPKNYTPCSRSVKALKHVDVALIDECGMLRMDHFSYFLNCVKKAEKKYHKHIQIVLVGDFLQLPPVVTEKEREKLCEYYGNKLMYQAYEDEDLWRQCFFKIVSLKKNRRQVDDIFSQMMDLARIGDTSCVEYFNRFSNPNAYYMEDGYVHLCAYRKDVNKINNYIISKHKNCESYQEFKAEVIQGEFDEKTSHLETLAFYEGMPVMATKNTNNGYQNGSMGTVVKVCKKTVMVQFLGNEKLVRVSAKTLGEGALIIKQIPLVPAYAVTIHKCQSQTFDKVVVHQGMFGEGQAYVALSRVKSPEGLVICGTLKNSDIERPFLQNGYEKLGLRPYEYDLMFG